MRLLVLGGTGFLGRWVAVAAVAAGHDVTVTGRGRTGSPPVGARFVHCDRDQGLAALAGEFDVVVDVAAMNYPWVAAAVDRFRGHYVFVSTVNVYADLARTGLDESAPTVAPQRIAGVQPLVDAQEYGAINVACEQVVLARGGTVLRPGLIVGPGDPSARFSYWPLRFARGGRAVVPHVTEHPTQFVDVRDLASWLVELGAQRFGGVFNAVGPSAPLSSVLAEMAAPFDVDLVPVPVDVLRRHNVQPWSGRKSLPLWLPPGLYGMAALDVSAALLAGLRIRPLHETVSAILAAPADCPHGLTLTEEAELL